MKTSIKTQFFQKVLFLVIKMKKLLKMENAS